MKSIYLMVLLIAVTQVACKEKGCMDRHAVNFDPNNDVVDTSNSPCCYSTVSFYLEDLQLSLEADATFKADSCSAIDSAIVFIGEKRIGKLSIQVYDVQSLNCSAPNLLNFDLPDGEIHDWYAELYAHKCDQSSFTFYIMGRVQSKINQSCQTIKIH